MRSSFPGHYPPSEDELNEMWTVGSIILDANALLNLFRYSIPTRKDFFSVLDNLHGRLWIPAQVGQEFHANRLIVIDEQRNALSKISKDLDSAERDFENTLRVFNEHSSLDAKALLGIHTEAIKSVKVEIGRQERLQAGNPPSGHSEPEIWQKIATLFNDKVGKSYSQDQLKAIYEEGEKRYESKVPPGYRDADKGVPRKYGDLVLWKQILDRVASKPDAAIFITDDGKEDWWLIRNGQTIGPRPELIEEYFYSSSGKRIHFYSPKEFLKYGKERLKIDVSEKSLLEVENVSTQESAKKRLQDEDSVFYRQNQLRSYRRVSNDEPNAVEYEEAMRRRRESNLHEHLTRSEVLEERRRAEVMNWLRDVPPDASVSQSEDLAGPHPRFRGLDSRFDREENIRERIRGLEDERNHLAHSNSTMSMELRHRKMDDLTGQIQSLIAALDVIEEHPERYR